MNRTMAELIGIACLGAAAVVQAQPPAPLHLVQTLTMEKSVTGRWIRSVTGLGKPAGIVYVPETNRVLFSDGAGSYNVLDAATYTIVATVKLLDDADSIGFDRDAKIMYVVNGGKDVGEKFSRLTIVDTRNQKSLGEIKIDGERVEAMALEKGGPRLFINVTALKSPSNRTRRNFQGEATGS